MLDAHSGLAQASALDLSQNGIGHFGIPRQHARLNHVSILMMGRLWGFVGVDILQTSTGFIRTPLNRYGPSSSLSDQNSPKNRQKIPTTHFMTEMRPQNVP